LSILGIGTDLVKIGRIEAVLSRHRERFIERCFTVSEAEDFQIRAKKEFATMVAGRWAAKEAFLKAIGGNISNIPYHDISVVRDANGAPLLEALGAASVAFSARGGQRAHLSISHEKEYAIALVIIES
jgi:holo-[acyl-carrier protein] synthase